MPALRKSLFFFSLVFLCFTGVPAQEETEDFETILLPPVEDYYRFKTDTGSGYKITGTTKVWVGGDVMFNWGVRDAMRAPDPLLAFRSFSSWLSGMDYRFLNLETPVLKKAPSADKMKSYVFYGEKDDLNLLKDMKIDGVSLANNHTMDFGETGLFETLSLLDEYKIPYSGAGKNEAESLKPLSFTTHGKEFRIFSFSDTGETRLFSGPRSPGAAYFRVSTAERLIKKSKQNHVNLLSLHWGVEYSPEPTDVQRKTAKYLVQAGYQAIIGHHPHIPQGIEVFPKGVVIYSLGNFFFGSKNQYLKHNISAILHFKNGTLVCVEVVPVFGKHQTVQGGLYFSPLGPKEAEEFLKEYSVLCKNLGTDLEISGGRGYVFLDKELKAKLNP
ncbi:CapA family protein [Leptospira idonii]|uniref:CapA family protein n=1 Tax=Leptospira idonii TaxID=1193500 RepID=A0A4R9LVA8_9LEPT|nr:CapA family protein [Leptospira idonii]TGN18173.1 CapA family protein [Leptospira idonii]